MKRKSNPRKYMDQESGQNGYTHVFLTMNLMASCGMCGKKLSNMYFKMQNKTDRDPIVRCKEHAV